MNWSTSSISLSLILIFSWFPAFILRVFVFPVLILRPTRLASSSYPVVFPWCCILVDESSATSSAKSRSSSLDVNFHLIPSKPSKYPRWINIMKTSTGTFPKHSPGRVAPRFSSPIDTIRIIIILLPRDQKCRSCVGSLSSRGCGVWPQDYVATMCV